jgi:hypothetical protein
MRFEGGFANDACVHRLNTSEYCLMNSKHLYEKETFGIVKHLIIIILNLKLSLCSWLRQENHYWKSFIVCRTIQFLSFDSTILG